MEKKFERNPNTPEFWERFYSKKDPAKERKNEWMYPYLESLVTASNFILDVGCGFGNTCFKMREWNRLAFIEGWDISETAILKARSRQREMKETHWTTFYARNIDHDPNKSYPAEYFDLIICAQSLEHMDRPDIAIRNMKHYLQKSGHLFLTVPWPNSSLDNGVSKHYIRFYQKDFKEWLPGCKIERQGKNHMIVIWQKK